MAPTARAVDANPIYIGKIESPDYGVSTRGDFEPIVDEATFYRAQAVLDGRVVVSGPRQRNRRDLPRAASCGARRAAGRSPAAGRRVGTGTTRTTTAKTKCRAVNVSKAVLEGAFVDERALLQPTPG
jgi:hypothetical protein